jgi:hypothetical protein
MEDNRVVTSKKQNYRMNQHDSRAGIKMWSVLTTDGQNKGLRIIKQAYIL